MAGITIRMSQLKQVLRMLSQGEAIKNIVRHTGISRTTVKRYNRLIHLRALNVEELLALEEPELIHLLQSSGSSELERHQDFSRRLDLFRKELENPHMTRQLLWEKYKREYPEGYQYSRFCYYLQQDDRSRKATMPIEHKAGDKLFIDFTGDKVHYVDRDTGELVTCELFVSTLGYSNFTTVVATHSQTIEDVIRATVTSLEWIGGRPRAIVPDNLKSAVQKADAHEPRINEAFLDMANHYGLVVLPTRVRKPKDKAKVERSVNLTYQRVLAPLRKTTFYSLEEMNTALREQTDLLNQRMMQQYDCSREALLERDERSLLGELPEQRYEIKHHLVLTVQHNGHIYVSRTKQYYSAPYRHIGCKVHVITTSTLLRIYYKGTIIATHAIPTSRKYNTIPQHMASHHRAVLEGMNEDRIREKASVLGAPVLQVIEQVLARSVHPEQAYKSCQGILSLAHKTSKEILTESCLIALEYQVCTYRNIERLAHGRYANRGVLNPHKPAPLPPHTNIRGAEHYQS